MQVSRSGTTRTRGRAWHWFMKRSLGHELLVQPAGQVAVGWQSGGKPVA